MDFEKLIKERYSVRKFKKEPLSNEAVEKILQAGCIAPTGCNFQPVKILVIKGEKALKKLRDCTRCHFDAPCAFLICSCPEEGWVRPYDGERSAPVDASIVTTHMMLMAENIGVGTCWVMHFDPQKMCDAFSIPKTLTPHALLVAGYPHPDAAPAERHFSRKNINDITVYDSF